MKKIATIIIPLLFEHHYFEAHEFFFKKISKIKYVPITVMIKTSAFIFYNNFNCTINV